MDTNKRDVESLNRGIVESDFYRFNAFNVFNGLTRLCPNQSPSRSGFDASRSDLDRSNQIKPNQTGKFFARTNRMNHGDANPRPKSEGRKGPGFERHTTDRTKARQVRKMGSEK
jgi:hypothetical protein